MNILDKMYLDIRLDNNEIITVAIKNNSVALSHYTDYGDLNASMVMSIPALLAVDINDEPFVVLSIAQEMMLDTINANTVFRQMMRGIIYFGVTNAKPKLLPSPVEQIDAGSKKEG